METRINHFTIRKGSAVFIVKEPRQNKPIKNSGQNHRRRKLDLRFTNETIQINPINIHKMVPAKFKKIEFKREKIDCKTDIKNPRTKLSVRQIHKIK